MPKVDSAAQLLTQALRDRSNLRMFHYSCGLIGEGPSAPPVQHICVSDFDSRTETFARTNRSERGEKEMLQRFFAAARKERWRWLVGWKTRNSSFGWIALARRFSDLGGKTPAAPTLIDMSAAFEAVYGRPLAEHPVLPELARLNGCTMQGSLDEAGRAAAWDDKQIEKLLANTQRRVRLLCNLLAAYANKKLVTALGEFHPADWYELKYNISTDALRKQRARSLYTDVEVRREGRFYFYQHHAVRRENEAKVLAADQRTNTARCRSAE